jgi:CO dehydrogenase maturation factor
MLAEVLSSDADVVVVDMEAGLEHLARAGGTLQSVDHLLVMIEPYAKAVETARRTALLARELGIPSISGVGSKVRDSDELHMVERVSAEAGLPLIAVLPYDDSVRLADREGRSPLDVDPDSAVVREVAQLARRLQGG